MIPSAGASTVLVVEDDQGIRETLQALFESEGYSVAVARDGLEALESLRRGHEASTPEPQVILLDMNMPRMNGRELLAVLAAQGLARSSKVLVLAAARAQEALPGTVGWLSKPVDIDVLLGAVAGLCGRD